MNKLDYDGGLRRQCMTVPALCKTQVEGVLKGIEDGIDKDSLKKLDRIYITGSGDSYAAAFATVPALERYAGAFGTQVICDTPMHTARYLNLGKDAGARSLLIAISCWGFPRRVVEGLRRAAKWGFHTIDVTNFPDTPVGHEAKQILMVNTPEVPDMYPGCRDYLGSWVGVLLLAATIAECKDPGKKGAVQQLAQAIIQLGQAYAPLMERMDNEMFALAQSWKDLSAFEGIGDGPQFASAFFFPAKIIEVAGVWSTWSNTEEWCHVGAHAQNPQTIGTLISADIHAGNKSRIAEAVKLAVDIGRPVLFVGNAPKEEFGITQRVAEFTVPAPPKDYDFLNPMLDHLPPSILASYISAFLSEPYFRQGAGGAVDFSTGTGDNVWSAERGASTLSTSQVVLVD